MNGFMNFYHVLHCFWLEQFGINSYNLVQTTFSFVTNAAGQGRA